MQEHVDTIIDLLVEHLGKIEDNRLEDLENAAEELIYSLNYDLGEDRVNPQDLYNQVCERVNKALNK